nr:MULTISPECIES: type VI secretion system ImpA family N-terminal domain-containing protein [unclassified Methylobacterium]
MEPITADSACGDDLDDTGDIAFLNGVAQVESRLPTVFLFRDADGELKIFDRSKIDFGKESEVLIGLLSRTRDLRLLVLLGRLTMLDRDLHGFGQVVTVIAAFLDQHWDAVHPGAAGDYDFRAAILQNLENNPTIVLPLQYTTLFRSRRHGPISFRHVMVAAGEVPPAAEHPGADRAAIAQALDEADPAELSGVRDDLTALADAIGRVEAITAARGGHDGGVRLGLLGDLVRRMRAFLGEDAAVPAAKEPEPGLQEVAEADASVDRRPPVPSVGAVATPAQATAALAAAAAYLRVREPSSPAEVLVRQAQTLVGKSFVDVMRILMPDQAPDVAIVLGAGRRLRLTFDQLAAVPDSDESEPTPEETDSAGGGAVMAEALPSYRATTRTEAITLLRAISDYFRRSEPASPIPLLLEKAAALADRDFLSVLKDVLSEDRPD